MHLLWKGANGKYEPLLFCPLFTTLKTTNIIVYRSVKYSKILIGILRCLSCKDMHYDSKAKAIKITLVIVILAVLLLIYFFLSIHPFVSALGFLAIIAGAFYRAEKLNESYVVDQGIYTLRDWAETNEVVRDLVISGWSFEQPSA